MYKLIIVDDEEVVREGFRQFVDWNALGFQLVATFEDGSEAIDFLQDNMVDAVLTDIDMVNVNGIELAQYIYHHCPNTKTILVSGHKDFEYAKKALDYQVVKYLIKPTELSEVTTLFHDMKKEFDEEVNQQQEVVRYKQKYDNILPLLKEQFLLSIISGIVRDENELVMRLSSINFPNKFADSNCCILQLDIVRAIDESSLLSVTSTLKKIYNSEKDGINYMAISKDDHHILILALSLLENDTLLARIHNEITNIRTTMEKNFGVIFSYKASPIFTNILELSSYTNSSLTTSISEINTTTALGIKDYRDFVQQYKHFIPHIVNGEMDLIIEKLNKMMGQLESLPIQDVQRLLIDLFSMVTQHIAEIGINVLDIRNVAYQGILMKKTLEEIKLFSQECLKNCVDICQSNRVETSSDTIIEKAKKYIDENYDQDISLEDIADYVYLHHAYFSRIFKEHVGENFSDYLTKVRIENAIRLLKENKYKTYEISEKIGYKSSKYFARVFKKVTGFTPREYIRHYTNMGSIVND